MTSSDQPFVPVGLPPESSPQDSLDERVGLHLLDALDSLAAVYESAAHFARVDSEIPVEEYTLDRCLESVHCNTGALWIHEGDSLVLHGDRNGAAARLSLPAVLATLARDTASMHNGGDARALLRPDADDQNVLVCPIGTERRRLGFVVILSPHSMLFDTGDVKLAAAVTSQAAIALSRAWHHRAVEIERQKLQLVVQNHSDGIAVVDRRGTTTLCNPIAQLYCGTSDLLPLLTSSDPTCTMEALGRGPTERELTIRAGGQTRIVGITSRDVRDRDGALANVILMLRDLTALRREEQLKRDFLSLISHKFRTPLTAMICAVQMLEAGDGIERDEFAAEMTRRTHELSVMVDRLLYFTELLEGSWSRKGTSDLRQLGAELQAQFTAQPGDGTLELDLAADAIEVPVPPARLRVALMNLVDNAVKFGSTGAPWVRMSSRRTEDGGFVVAIEDRGPGIPADARPHLFASFRQLESEFTGSVAGAGIGLAITREIANGLGGTLEHHDASPHGCVFTLRFPPAESSPR